MSRGATIRGANLRRVRLAECQECAEPIRFVRLPTGRLMPVNPRENPDGNVAAALSGDNLAGFVISADHKPGPLTPYRFMTHYATCSERKPSNPPTEPPPALF